MRLFLIIFVAMAMANPAVKPTSKLKKRKLTNVTFPRAGYCNVTCDTLTQRVTYLDEGFANCSMDGNYACSENVGQFCTTTSLKKCIAVDGGYCVGRCDLDGRTLSYDSHCEEGYDCNKNAKCTHLLRDQNFSKVACRPAKS